MLHLVQRSRRALIATGAIAGIVMLSGCQGHKIVARVNGAPIEETDWANYVTRVKANDFQTMAQSGISTDAGGVGLVTIIKERLLEKLAAEKNIRPTDEEVKTYGEYLRRTNPSVAQAITTGLVTAEDLPRVIRDQMQLFALGTDNANVAEEEIKKEFDTNKSQYDFPEIVGFRVVAVPDQTKGIELLNEIKAANDFVGPASKVMPQAGTVRYMNAAQLPKALQDALATLKDGQTATAPISLTNPSVPNSPPTYVVAQLVQRMPKGEAKLAEVREAIRQRKLQETHPDLLQHAQKVLTDYTKQANVEVYIDRYKEAVKQALLPPPDPFGGAPRPTPAPQGAPTVKPGAPTTIKPGAAPSGATPAPKKP